MSNSMISLSKETEMVLELSKESIKVRDLATGTIKECDPGELLKLLVLSKERSVFRIGRIPNGIVDLTFVEPGDEFIACVFTPPMNFNLRTDKHNFEGIHNPAMLSVFTVCKKRVTGTKIAALKNISTKEQIGPSTKIYRYPYAHSYDDFGVCWGNIGLPEVDNLNVLEMIPTAFWLNGMNSTAHNVYVDFKVDNVLNFYRDLQSGDISIEDHLLESRMVFSDFISSFMSYRD